MLGWKKHKLESRFLGEMSITSDIQMTPPFGRKRRRTKEPLDESERAKWKESDQRNHPEDAWATDDSLGHSDIKAGSSWKPEKPFTSLVQKTPQMMFLWALLYPTVARYTGSNIRAFNYHGSLEWFSESSAEITNRSLDPVQSSWFSNWELAVLTESNYYTADSSWMIMHWEPLH